MSSWWRNSVFIGIAAVALIATIFGLFALVAIFMLQPDAVVVSRRQSWRDEVCLSNAPCSKGWSTRPLILISLDGFGAAYLARHKTPAIRHLIECGTHSPFIYPSYPSKTFPSHHTIATGLYPESHGIVDNWAYDPCITPRTERIFRLGRPSSFNAQWWKGEPFWNTVMKNGMKAATYFWPGSEVKMQGMLPTFYRRFDSTVAFSERMDQLIRWLSLPNDERPHFFAMYFSQPDTDGHLYGPDSNKVNDALLHIDSMINYLMTSLHDLELIHCVDVILVADHGMQSLIPDAIMAVGKHLNTSGMHVFSGPVGRIHLENSTLTADEVVKSLQCKNASFRVYRRQDLPLRLHYSKSLRCGDVIIDSDPGYRVFEQQPSEQQLGNHGYDYRLASMHALFVASGPSFKKNFTGRPFQTIELYHLMADLLHIDPEKRAPNNGTMGSLRYLLTEPQHLPIQRVEELPNCNFDALVQCGTCAQERNQDCGAERKLALESCAPAERQTCAYMGCQLSSVYSRKLEVALMVQGEVTSQSSVNMGQPDCNYDDSAVKCANINALTDKLAARHMRLSPLYVFAGRNIDSNRYSQKAAMHNGFVTDVWSKLQNLTLSYAHKFGRLLIMSGPIFDFNHDGLADDLEEITSNIISGQPMIPSHFYQVLLRCDSGWLADGRCSDAGTIHVLTFALPNRATVDNCHVL